MFISDVEYDNFVGKIDSEELYSRMHIIAHCDKCECLHVYWNGFDKDAIVYFKE